MFGRSKELRGEFEQETMPHLEAMFGTAMRLTRNPRDAEDLVQDTLLRAYRFWGKFERGTNCKAWLLKILTNTFINRYHKARRDHELADEVARSSDTAESVLSQAAQEGSRDPEAAIAARGLSDTVLQALESLPPDFRVAVILCDLEELSYKEIAEAMECPVGTVMSRLFRGRKLLQKALHDHAVEQGIIRARAAAELPDVEEAKLVSLAAYRAVAGKKTKGGAS
jgi:RNA polymerase sigma-70 factor (ECF subfamily)